MLTPRRKHLSERERCCAIFSPATCEPGTAAGPAAVVFDDFADLAGSGYSREWGDSGYPRDLGDLGDLGDPDYPDDSGDSGGFGGPGGSHSTDESGDSDGFGGSRDSGCSVESDDSGGSPAQDAPGGSGDSDDSDGFGGSGDLNGLCDSVAGCCWLKVYQFHVLLLGVFQEPVAV